jgi:hypothetical protein
MQGTALLLFMLFAGCYSITKPSVETRRSSKLKAAKAWLAHITP